MKPQDLLPSSRTARRTCRPKCLPMAACRWLLGIMVLLRASATSQGRLPVQLHGPPRRPDARARRASEDFWCSTASRRNRRVHNLIDELPRMQSMAGRGAHQPTGAAHARNPFPSLDAVRRGTGRCIDAWRATQPLVPDQSCNGYWHGQPGLDLVDAEALVANWKFFNPLKIQAKQPLTLTGQAQAAIKCDETHPQQRNTMNAPHPFTLPAPLAALTGRLPAYLARCCWSPHSTWVWRASRHAMGDLLRAASACASRCGRPVTF